MEKKQGKWKLNASIETLVCIAADPDPLCGPLALAEIDERLLEVKTTALAVRYLLPKDEADRADAHEGLLAICLKAKGKGLYLNPAHAEDGGSEHFFHHERRPAMRLFIEGALETIFRPYQEKDPKEIIAAALAGKFRYIGRTVKFRIIDEVRRYKREKKRRVRGKPERRRKQKAFSDLVTMDTSEQNSPPVRPKVWDIPSACADIKKDEARYRSAFGEKNWDTLLSFAEVSTDERETKRGQKGRLTRLLAERRGVSLRQARADKKRLLLRAQQLKQNQRRAKIERSGDLESSLLIRPGF